MNSVTSTKFINALVVIASSLFLVACTSAGTGTRDGVSDATTIGAEQARSLPPNPAGELLGSGNVRVALLIPASVPGAGAGVATELRNGAVLAMQNFGQSFIQLVIKDTKGQAAVAQEATAEAVTEGSTLVLGPLFAANVGAAAGAARPANIPIVAFSTDTSVAQRGVYLFSYTPQADTARIMNYASSIGKRSIVAFLPRNAEGDLRANVIRQIAGAASIAVNVVRYERTPEGVEDVAAEGLPFVEDSDSIYIPEGGALPNLILSRLKRNGAELTGKQVFGAGTWESIDAGDPFLDGAIFPGRDKRSFEGFAKRYESRFGTAPGVQAALAFDVVTLAAELARQNGPQNPFPETALESARGFHGVNGAFRIRSDGSTERGLSIYQIGEGEARLLEGAISRFSGS